MRKLISTIIAVSCFFCVHAQLGLSSSTAPGGLQNFLLNPALVDSDHSIYIGLGFLNIDAYNSDGDLFGATSRNGDNELVVDLEELIGSLDSLNDVSSVNELMSFYFGTRIGGLRLGLFHAFKADLEVKYPRQLPELLWYGNGPYIGETLEIGPELNYNLYNQLGLHVAYEFERLSLGVNVSRIFGSAYGRTEKDLIEITTDTAFYEITAKTDYEILSSSSLTYYNPNTLEVENDKWTDLNLNENAGWSLDIGASYDLSPTLNVHAFVKDLGYIDYDEKVQRIFSKNEFIYEGSIIDEGIFDNELDYDLSLDTILEEFEFDAVDADDFRHNLNSTWGFGADYQWTERTNLVFLYSSRESAVSDDRNSMIHLGFHHDFFRFLRANVNYSYKFERHNLGLGFSLHPGPIDFYLYTDNVLSAFQSDDGQLTAIMTGLSFRI